MDTWTPCLEKSYLGSIPHSSVRMRLRLTSNEFALSHTLFQAIYICLILTIPPEVLSPFPNEDTEAERSDGTCPRKHS